MTETASSNERHYELSIDTLRRLRKAASEELAES